MNRAYSILEVKAVEEEERVIRGVATTPTPDRVGDIVEPLGVKFKNPMPLLHQHDAERPVGTVKFDKPTKDGITFEARLPKIDTPGPLKDRVDTAWGEVKAGLVRAVSIGFRTLKDGYEWMDSGGIRFLKTEVLELSLVTVPANADAKISTIKSIDRPLLAASGNEPRVTDRPVLPGASGSSSNSSKSPKEGRLMKTIAEQIAAYRGTREVKSARMTQLMNDSAEAGVTLDAAQTEEYDTLEEEVKQIDAHLKRLETLERGNRQKAAPVEGVTGTEAGSAIRGGVRVEVKGPNLPKGTAFTRYAMALMRAKGNLMQAAEIAKGWHDSTPEVETVLKAAVAAGTTTDASWARPLVEYQNLTQEFAELLRPATILGRIQGLRRVPFNIKVPRQTGGSTIGWVGQGAPKPVGRLTFDQISLGIAKTAGIVVMSDELVRSSNPSAEAIVRQDMIDQTAQFLDQQFVDPAVAAVQDVSPASVTNGVDAVEATGTDADAVRADVRAVMGRFIAANMSLAGAVWIMTEMDALALSLMLNALGQPEFPGLVVSGNAGGTFFSLPVILSENIPRNQGSGDPVAGAGSRIILAKANEILLADDGEVVLDASREASVQMNATPDNPATAATVMVSLWQNNLVGLKAERFINWSKRRPGAVQYIDGANYGNA